MEHSLKKRILSTVHPDRTFKTHTGIEIWGLQDLLDYLEITDEKTFKHHVSGKKNDFAQWIDNVLGDKDLATRLRTTKNLLKTQDIIAQRIILLEKETHKEEAQHTPHGRSMDITHTKLPLPPKNLEYVVARDLPPLEYLKLNAQLVMLGMAIGVLIGVIVGVILGGYR